MNKPLIVTTTLLVLFLIAAGLSLLPIPSVFIAFLLAAIAASFIYYLLGGITSEDKFKFNHNDQLVVQLAGSAAVFVVIFVICHHYINSEKEKVITIKPPANSFVVLNEDGEVLRLSQQAPYQWVGKPITTRDNLQDLPLVPIINGGDIFVKPKKGNENNLIGRLFGGSEQGDPEFFFENLRRDNYYHPLLNALRSANCDGPVCTDKTGAGFQVIVIADQRIKPGELVISARQFTADDLLKEIEKAPNQKLNLKLSKSSTSSKQIDVQIKAKNINIEDSDSLPKALVSKEVYTKIFGAENRQRGYLSFSKNT